MDQQLFQWIVGGLCGIFGWLLNSIWRAVRDQQLETKEIAERIAGVEILVAGQYVKRDEMERNFAAIFRKLDVISDKLDGKADK